MFIYHFTQWFSVITMASSCGGIKTMINNFSGMYGYLKHKVSIIKRVLLGKEGVCLLSHMSIGKSRDCSLFAAS